LAGLAALGSESHGCNMLTPSASLPKGWRSVTSVRVCCQGKRTSNNHNNMAPTFNTNAIDKTNAICLSTAGERAGAVMQGFD
jgi:hypothetical protein